MFFMLPEATKLFNYEKITKRDEMFTCETIRYVIGIRERGGNQRNNLIDALIEIKKLYDEISDEILDCTNSNIVHSGSRNDCHELSKIVTVD